MGIGQEFPTRLNFPDDTYARIANRRGKRAEGLKGSPIFSTERVFGGIKTVTFTERRNAWPPGGRPAGSRNALGPT